jgi:hypothetical protein
MIPPQWNLQIYFKEGAITEERMKSSLFLDDASNECRRYYPMTTLMNAQAFWVVLNGREQSRFN